MRQASQANCAIADCGLSVSIMGKSRSNGYVIIRHLRTYEYDLEACLVVIFVLFPEIARARDLSYWLHPMLSEADEVEHTTCAAGKSTGNKIANTKNADCKLQPMDRGISNTKDGKV